MKRIIGTKVAEVEIEYLVKFVPVESYADDLLNGCLFMNAAGYYAVLENGQGDEREGAMGCYGIRRNVDHPIYCMYSVFKGDIDGHYVTLPSQCLDDFKCRNGYAVVIPFAEFEARLPSLQTGGHALNGGLVVYGNVSNTDAPKLLAMDSDTPLFIKRPEYSYQNEYRLVVNEALPRNLVPGELNGVQVEFIDQRQPYAAKSYWFPGPLSNIGRKVSIATLPETDDGVILDLRALGLE